MKKITLLFFFTSTFFAFAQNLTWDFDATNDGWTPTNFTETTGTNALQLNATGTNPKIDLAANFKSQDYEFAGITLKVTGTGPTLIRFGYARTASPTNFTYINRPIANNTSNFITYYINLIDVPNGDVSNLSVEFKNNDGTVTGADFTNNGAIIEIDNITLFDGFDDDQISKTDYDFNLDYDTDQWTAKNAQLQGPMGGVLTFQPQNNAISSVRTADGTFYEIPTNGSTRNYLNITLKNENSNIDEIRVEVGFSDDDTAIKSITTSDTGYKTYIIDLSVLPEWKSKITDVNIFFVNSTTQESSASGNILIDEISFSRDRLNSSKFEKSDFITLYPNPAIDVINLSSKNSLNFAKLEITDLNGRLIKSITLENVSKKEINISELTKGLYFGTIQSGNKMQTIKFIKK